MNRAPSSKTPTTSFSSFATTTTKRISTARSRRAHRCQTAKRTHRQGQSEVRSGLTRFDNLAQGESTVRRRRVEERRRGWGVGRDALLWHVRRRSPPRTRLTSRPLDITLVVSRARSLPGPSRLSPGEMTLSTRSSGTPSPIPIAGSRTATATRCSAGPRRRTRSRVAWRAFPGARPCARGSPSSRSARWGRPRSQDPWPRRASSSATSTRGAKARNQPILYVREGVRGEDACSSIPTRSSADGTTALDWWSPSNDGTPARVRAVAERRRGEHALRARRRQRSAISRDKIDAHAFRVDRLAARRQRLLLHALPDQGHGARGRRGLPPHGVPPSHSATIPTRTRTSSARSAR